MSNEELILESARTLVRSDERWSMSALAREAGISRATLYRSFSSRREVEEALSESGLDLVVSGDPRERCLNAVAALATTVGLHRMTIEAVAKEAGVGVATVYRLFENRKGLLRAFTMERSPRALVEKALLRKDAPLRETLEALVLGVMQQVQRDGPWLSMMAAPDPETRELASEFASIEREGRGRLGAFLRRYVKRGELEGKPELLAESLLSLAAGRVLFAAVDGKKPGSNDAEQLVHIFLEGARRA